jgi:hypothetical protein
MLFNAQLSGGLLLCFIAVILVVSMIFMPDSPMYLISKQKHEEARKALQWLRGKHYNVDAELKEMQLSNEEEQKIGSISLTTLFTKGVYLRPFLLGMFIMFAQQFSGVNAVNFHLHSIFDKAGSTIEPGKLF